ncbi:alpha/beta hydrolase [Streptomyces liangshanensis]|uniref:Phospholipase n=1 Tax=Streptomyces liangshanensis TaxID=2717324 RepID=A0A6G9H703_9ACTN|nr:phospholipase [Streptomyces liangshanensis]QIQ06313.1 phospholipase [Streptomyces liangshanensis]
MAPARQSPVSPLVVRWSRAEGERAGTPLLLALHGRGSDERAFSGIAPYLPEGLTIAFVRAPIAEGGGYAWFTNRGIGRPVAESIADSAAQVLDWLDTVADRHTSVSVLGFSGGMAMAGGLLFTQPERFSSAVLLSGTLPWDAGLPAGPGRLAGVRVLWGRDEADTVIPADLVARTGRWLREESGADLAERVYPALGHALGEGELHDIHTFLAETGDRPS